VRRFHNEQLSFISYFISPPSLVPRLIDEIISLSSLGDLLSNFFHSPQSPPASIFLTEKPDNQSSGRSNIPKARRAADVMDYQMDEDGIPVTGSEELESHLQILLQSPDTPLDAKLFDEVSLQLTGTLHLTVYENI
jgi:hypothetical protein